MGRLGGLLFVWIKDLSGIGLFITYKGNHLPSLPALPRNMFPEGCNQKRIKRKYLTFRNVDSPCPHVTLRVDKTARYLHDASCSRWEQVIHARVSGDSGPTPAPFRTPTGGVAVSRSKTSPLERTQWSAISVNSAFQTRAACRGSVDISNLFEARAAKLRVAHSWEQITRP